LSRQTDRLRPDICPAARPLLSPLFPKILTLLTGAALALAAAAAWAADILVTSTRVWPAPDYTRITIESQQAIRYKFFSIDNPDRLVLDIDDVALSATLNEISGKISTEDPYLKGVRVGRFKPGTVRLVFDLKSQVKPEAFALTPVGEYGHRLVLDIYPLQPPDPLLAFLKKHEAAQSSGGTELIPPDAPAVPTPAPQQPLSQRLITIAIDPGHGGEDPGARGRRGTLEKNVTLAISRRLKERIDAEPGMRAVLLRDADFFMSLGARVEKARRIRADLLVSVHADAFIKPSASGSSVFTLSERGATSAAARWLAKQENDADLIGGVNLGIKDTYLKQTLLDLSQTASINDSMKLAKAVLSEMSNINKLHKNYVEQAGFAVLKAPDIPSILVETAFISNPEEEQKLRNPEYQGRMAEAIFTGIKRYFSKNPPLAPAKVVSNP